MASSNSKRTRLLAALVLACLVMISGCAGNGGSSSGGGGGPFRVALIADLTGPLATIISTALPGGLTAIDQVNKSGGVNGRQIQVTGTYDSASTAAAGIVAARSALSDKPDLILSFAGSAPTSALVPLLKQSKIPALSTFLPDALAYPTDHNVWGFSAGERQQGQFAVGSAKTILGKVEGAKIAFEYLQTPGAESSSVSARGALEKAGAQVVDVQGLPNGATTFASQASRIARLNPDLYVVSDGAANVQTVVAALRTAGWNGPVVTAGESANSESDFQGIGDGRYYSPRGYQPPIAGSPLQATAKPFGYNLSGSHFAYGWSQTQSAIAALKNCAGDCSQEALIEAFDHLGNFVPTDNASTGPLKFTPDNRIVITTEQLFKWDKAQGNAVPEGNPMTVQPAASY